MKHGNFLKSVAIITIGGFAAKGIGALYKIPLVGLLGGYGTGLYQMAYPLFCVLLTFSSAGIPSAFSRIVARERAKGYRTGDTVQTALRLFALLGLFGTVLMCLFAPQMSALQGDDNLRQCYYALAPSVFFVAVIAVLRGYFQGKNDMAPTAVSEIVEQVIKAGAGLLFALRFSNEPARAVAYTLAAVSVSELFALGYLAVRYRREGNRGCLRVRKTSGSEILSSAFPVMASAALLPLSQTVDSVVIVRLLSAYTTRAVSLYGLYAGAAVSLVNLPATVCYGLAAASVPAVSAYFARGEEEKGRTRALFALAVTFLLSVPAALALFFFAKPAVQILYPSLPAEDAAVLVRLIRLSSVSAATLAAVDTLAACLTGMGRAKYAAAGMACAVLVKFALQWTLVSNPAISVGGAAIASNACYLVAFCFDLVYTLKKKVGRQRDDNGNRVGRRSRRRDRARVAQNEGSGKGIVANGRTALGADGAGGGNRV